MNLILFNSIFIVLGELPLGLKQLLHCSRRNYDTGGKKTYVEFDLFIEEDDITIVQGGLLKKVIDWCKSRNIAIEISEDNRKKITNPDWDQLKKVTLREKQSDVIAAITSNYSGIVNVTTGFGKTFIIGVLSNLIGKTNKIIVSTKSIAVLDSIYTRLSEQCPTLKVNLVKAGNPFNKDADICVCSLSSLHNIPREWPSVMFFDECHHLASPETSNRVIEFNDCCKFGFSATPYRGDNTELLLEATLGPHIIDISYQEAEKLNLVVPIDVYIQKYPVSPLNMDWDIGIKRYGIWRNYDRNKCIAQTVKSFSDNTKCLIMVTTVEHALYLHKLLPGYKIVHGAISKEKYKKFSEEGLITKGFKKTINKKKALQDFKDGVFTKVISTLTWKEGIDLPSLEVIVRADGQAGKTPSLQIGGRSSRIHGNKKRGILIDFLDTHHKKLEGKSYVRIKHYKSNGWRIIYGLPH